VLESQRLSEEDFWLEEVSDIKGEAESFA